jgi:hypothetical protein
MAVFYKNQGFNLNTTNLTTTLTIATDSNAIVKSISVTNESNTSVLTEMYVYDASATTNFEFYHAKIPGNCTDQAAGQVLNLEANDAIKIQVATSDVIKGVISYALLNRTDQNG